LRQLRHGLCMCAIQRVNGKNEIFKCLWTGYGSRCQADHFVSRTLTLQGFSRSTVSRVYQERSTTQRTSSQLDTTVGSIGVNMGQHPCGTLSTPWVHDPTNWICSEAKGGCNSVLCNCIDLSPYLWLGVAICYVPQDSFRWFWCDHSNNPVNFWDAFEKTWTSLEKVAGVGWYFKTCEWVKDHACAHWTCVCRQQHVGAVNT
jgi:hypothetical protein